MNGRCPNCGHIQLTDLDRQVLAAIAAGHNNTWIAATILHTSYTATTTWISRLYGRVGCGRPHPRRDAAALAEQLGITGDETP